MTAGTEDATPGNWENPASSEASPAAQAGMRWMWIGSVTLLASTVWLVWSLATLSIDRQASATSPGSSTVASLWHYWLAVSVCWAALLVFAFGLLRCERMRGHRNAPKGVGLLIVLVALLARLVTVAVTSPQLSDDIWRYIHDGRSLASGQNPYESAPSESPLPDDKVRQQINHPDLVTIYQPTSQWVFAGLARLHETLPEEWRRWDPLGDRMFRVGFSLLDVLAVVVILLTLKQLGASAWWAVLYAWHPLTITETAATGHQDIIGIVTLLICVWASLKIQGHDVRHSRDLKGHRDVAAKIEDEAANEVDGPGGAGSRRLGWAVVSGAALAASIAVKPIVFPIALLLTWRHRAATRVIWFAAVSALLVGAGLYLPFALSDGGIGRSFETAGIFARDWAFNSPVHAPLAKLLVSKWVTNFVVVGAIGWILICLVRGQVGFIASVAAYFFLSLVLSSTVHPWYLLWALAILPLLPSVARDYRTATVILLAVSVLSLTITWSYVVLVDVQTYRLPIWVCVVEYLPVAVVAWLAARGRIKMPCSALVTSCEPGD